MTKSNARRKPAVVREKAAKSTGRLRAERVATKCETRLAHVIKSGLELVPERKHRGKPATLRDYAKLAEREMKPWTYSPDEPTPDKIVHDCAVSAWVSFVVMTRTKDQLIAMHRDMSIDHLDGMMFELAQGAEKLKLIVSMIEAAEARMLVAGSVAAASKVAA